MPKEVFNPIIYLLNKLRFYEYAISQILPLFPYLLGKVKKSSWLQNLADLPSQLLLCIIFLGPEILYFHHRKGIVLLSPYS